MKMLNFASRISWIAVSIVGISVLAGCQPKCFGAGTRIDTPSGSIPIERIKAGDHVWSYDLASGRRRVATVVQTFVHHGRHLRTLRLEDGRALRVTDEHPFYLPAENRFARASELAPGTELLVRAGASFERRVVQSLSAEELAANMVYNLEVAGFHNYFAEGILVHNKTLPCSDQDEDGACEYYDCDDNDPNVTTGCPDAGAGGTGGTCEPSCSSDNTVNDAWDSDQKSLVCSIMGISIGVDVNLLGQVAPEGGAPEIGDNTYDLQLEIIIGENSVNLFRALSDSAVVASTIGIVTPGAGTDSTYAAGIALDNTPCQICFERDTALHTALPAGQGTWTLNDGSTQTLRLNDVTLAMTVAGIMFSLSTTNRDPACYWESSPPTLSFSLPDVAEASSATSP